MDGLADLITIWTATFAATAGQACSKHLSLACMQDLTVLHSSPGSSAACNSLQQQVTLTHSNTYKQSNIGMNCSCVANQHHNCFYECSPEASFFASFFA
jgi:hypothetical protein